MQQQAAQSYSPNLDNYRPELDLDYDSNELLELFNDAYDIDY